MTTLNRVVVVVGSKGVRKRILHPPPPKQIAKDGSLSRAVLITRE